MKKSILSKRLTAIVFCTLIILACVLPLVSCEKTQEQKNTTYSIFLDIGDDKIYCTQSLYFVNNSEYVLDDLVFNVYANAYDSQKPLPCTPQEEQDAYPNGASFGKFELQNVYGDFESYIYDSKNNLITVKLNDALLPTEDITVEFVYTLIPPNTNLRYGYNDICLSLTGFYPQLCAMVDGEWFYRPFSAIGDPYFSDTADYKVQFNLPEACEYVCSGKSQSHEQNGETFITSTARNIRDFALIISPVLKKTTENYKGIELSYLGEETQVIEYAKKAIDIYSGLFGTYAYDSLALASTPFVAGGMEYGGLCVISDSLTGSDIESVTAHEIAHEWWYSAVGSNNLTDAWQDEGLAEYSTYLYFCQKGSQDYADMLLSSAYIQYSKFVELGQKVGEPVKGMLAGELDSFASNYHYTNLTYNKAFILWHYAEQCLGRQTLLSALKSYYNHNKFSIASTDDLYLEMDNAQKGTSKLMKSWIKNC